MFQKLKFRLILLYGITSSVILTVILTGISILNYRQNYEQEKLLFQKNAEQIIEKVGSDNIINNAWMLRKQLENDFIVIVEENGKQLSGYSRLETRAVTEELVQRLKEKSAEDGIRLDRRPLYSKVEKTPVLILNTDTGGSYLGFAALIPKYGGWQNIMAFSGNGAKTGAQTVRIFLYSILDLIGVAALFVISTLYIRKVIKPLEEGQEKQNAFVAAASHELRSPLTVIKTGVASIREDLSKAEQFLPHVEGECDRMTRLINDMLLLAAADAKAWKLQKEEVDMDTLLIECYDMVCSCLNRNRAVITLDLPESELYKINGDRERIKQILTILVDNALSHTPVGGRIALRAYHQKRSVVIEVEDHGNGISDEDKKHVFERFYRGDQSRNAKKHFGLGLSIAKELAELHQGEIILRDTPGGGATFAVRFPC